MEDEPNMELKNQQASVEIREASVAESYIDLRAINLGSAVVGEYLEPGEISVQLGGELEDEYGEMLVQGKLYENGIVNGLSKIYAQLQPRPGDTFEYSVRESGGQPTAVLESLNRAEPIEETEESDEDEEKYRTLLNRKDGSHIHIEPFRPENLDHWVPETETDVYMVFGTLQEFTDFQYCCGASKDILRRLDIDYYEGDDEGAKPDAILIDRVSGEYLIAEWKMNSSDFSSNHNASDVDVLVCWEDDEDNRELLPNSVLELRTTAKSAVENILSTI